MKSNKYVKLLSKIGLSAVLFTAVVIHVCIVILLLGGADIFSKHKS